MEASSKKVLVMVLCGGKGERLYPLTKDRAKPSVPFLGSYRIIDFSLSNAPNSGLRRIALLTQYKSLSLERHILNGWSIFHPESGEYIISLPAQGRVSDHWYEGTADAVLQNIYTIQQENPEAVLILSGDHIYKADYRKIIRFYLENQADAVVLAKVAPARDASRFGVMEINESRQITNFLEKPKKPPVIPWDSEKALVSMGVYLFRTPVLIKALLQDARNPKSSHDFGKDIIPKLVRDWKIFAYLFEDYWEDIGTIDAYWKANMAFLESQAPVVMNDPSWPIRSYKPQHPPTYIKDGDIRNSIIGAGCQLIGASIQGSIIAPGVKIQNDAVVRDSIILEGAEIRRDARVLRAIIDKFSVIPEGFEVGSNLERDGRHFKVSKDGVSVVPKNWTPA